MTVGLLVGNSQNQFLPDFAEENGFTYQTREYEDTHQMEAALQSGTIDATLTSNLRRAENERLLDTIKVDYFYAITRKDDQDLLDEINYAITQMNLYEGAGQVSCIIGTMGPTPPPPAALPSGSWVT